MRVAMYYNNKDVRIEEMPLPKINKGELLVKVIASGICGSDVLEWYRIKTAPRVLGHEISGDIVETGEGVKNYKKGDRVFVSHHVPCNTCHYCQNGYHTSCETLHKTNYDPGGFAEYLRVPEINVRNGVYVLPDNVSYEEGTFIEPLACITRGQRIANIKPQQTLLVIGSGISGLLHIHLAKKSGVKKIIATDVNKYRLEAASKFGADAVIDAGEDITKRVKELNGGMLADCVIICTGAISAINQAVKSVDRGGTILFFAVPEPGVDIKIPVTEFWRNEIKIMTSYGAGPVDIKKAIDLIKSKKLSLSDMITHRLSLTEAALGFKLVAEGKESIKVIIEPWN